MDQHISKSDINNPGSIRLTFKNTREYPSLEGTGYNWKDQKRLYSPRGLLGRLSRWSTSGVHKFGYVFTHRGLYERASRYVDNSKSAIDHGVDEGFFLHELDAFPGRRIHAGFLAHDQTADRVTALKGLWTSHPLDEILRANLVTRDVKLDRLQATSSSKSDRPDMQELVSDLDHVNFDVAYVETDEQVPGVEGTVWEQRKTDSGLFLQIDLRNEDFAIGIAHYAFHLSKDVLRSQPRPVRDLAWSVLHSTTLKGYNIHFKRFDKLVQAIQARSVEAYSRNVFEVEDLHNLPPLTMVFYSDHIDPMVKSSRDNPPDNLIARRIFYDKLYEIFLKQVSSFVGIGKRSYNFILAINHSGLGLLYDIETGKARNPLTGKPLKNKTVLFNSLVDRVMIDVSLELRRKHPKLLFSSCTRLADVIVGDQKYKADHKTGNLVPWEADEEKGLAVRLKAIHGGLYPQSHIVIADDPMSEIAARTWIDQHSGLDRRMLLRKPYYEWLEQAGSHIRDVVRKLNDDFLPNKCEEVGPVDPSLTNTSASTRTGPSENTHLSFEGLILPPPDYVPGPMAEVKERGNAVRESNLDKAIVGKTTSTTASIAERPRSLIPTRWAKNGFLFQNKRGNVQERAVLDLGGVNLVFYANNAELRHDLDGVEAYKAAEQGDGKYLAKLILKGADINASVGSFETALAVACNRGHYEIVQMLLDNKADANLLGSRFGNRSPLAYACEKNHLRIAQLLLRNGAKVDDDDKSIFGSPLELACINGHHQIVQLLLDNGAAFAKASRSTLAPLAFASGAGRAGVVRLLLDRGADVNASEGSADTALVTACLRGDMDIVNQLLSRQAQVNALSEDHRSPLAVACERGHDAIVQRLLDAGANVHTPIERIANAEIKKKLIRAGADADKQVTGLAKKQPRQGPEERLHKTIRPDAKASRYKEITPRLGAPPPSCGCFLCNLEQGLHENIAKVRYLGGDGHLALLGPKGISKSAKRMSEESTRAHQSGGF